MRQSITPDSRLLFVTRCVRLFAYGFLSVVLFFYLRAIGLTDGQVGVLLPRLHALHARSCLERGKLWQAEYMVSGVRDQALALACLRLGLPTSQGRGLDLLPAEVTAAAAEALVRAIAADELRRAFRVAIDCLLSEISEVDANLAARLERAVRELT